MKATELMIGDLVFVQGELSKIIEIHEHSVLLQGRSFYFGEEDIKAIPLTPEIFKKNGFEKVEWERNTYQLSSFRTDVWFSIDDCFYLGFDETAVQFNCYSVHELQHILRINRIDKEIIL